LSTNVIAADDHKGHDHDAKKSETHPHKAKPMYGGVVTVIKDINYELVAKADAITLYVTDHGKPLNTKDGTAAITLMSASGKADVTLTPAGENKFEAKGTYTVGEGSKAIAKVSLGGKPAQSVRFVLK